LSGRAGRSGNLRPKREPSSITAQFGENLMRRAIRPWHDHFAQPVEVTSFFVTFEAPADCRENFEFALVAQTQKVLA
jgi:hypothetical protein